MMLNFNLQIIFSSYLHLELLYSYIINIFCVSAQVSMSVLNSVDSYSISVLEFFIHCCVYYYMSHFSERRDGLIWGGRCLQMVKWLFCVAPLPVAPIRIRLFFFFLLPLT